MYLETFGTNTIDEDERIEKIVNTFDLTPQGIISLLNLDTPLFKKTTNYGHFTKTNLPWEKIIEM